MQQYTVTGMHCAACSASVEKAVKKVPGVTSCAVSLLTNSMGVEGTAETAAVIKAVEDAGYGASVRGQEATPAADASALEDRQTPHLKKRLIASVAFLLILMYFSMGHMCGAGRCQAGLTATTSPWVLSSCCWPGSSWSSIRNFL